ncbi:MAG: sigma-54-dependent Fis family transcriptional regulator, partial [Gemmatimonadetes bacterium]|nr:sigma-54-dependent Fis family transcriptional regulator [Gemmatimonadota bacterium]
MAERTPPESNGSAPVLAVLLRTESFARVWPELVGSIGGALRSGGTVAELAPLGEACSVIVALAGAEETAADVLAELRSAGAPECAVVGAAADHRVAARVLRAGAAEYFVLPADQESLRAWLGERVERAAAMERAAALAAYERERYDFSRLIGRSPGLLAALERAAKVIPRGAATVLITGETGTGKELLAQAIHYNGPRAASPFVEINCSALPATLLESELFGYEKGAFTDARAAKPGLFEAAHGGTLFLDEIGDLAPELQAKLLRVLEDRRIRRLGGLREFRVDMRIIAATHVDLGAAVRADRFRQDLYYRLSVFPIHLPPLRERGDDVVLLAEHFLAQFSAQYDLAVPPLPAAARQALLVHSWPGNVRELRNALERAILLGSGEIRPDDLSLETQTPTASPLPFPASMDEIEQAAARAMVERCGGNKS